jgi:hypothetical protein
MNTIHTYDNTNDRQGGFSQNSGLLFASDPSNYTMNSPLGLIVSGSQPVMGDIHALDNLSDEIGITHEAIEGEIIENSTNE